MDIQSSALNELFELWPVIIPGWVTPVKPANIADGGIPKRLYDDQTQGLECLIDPWFEIPRRGGTLQIDDQVDLYVNDDATPVAGDIIRDENKRMRLYLPHGRLVHGVNRLHYKVTRPSGGGGTSDDLNVLYHRRAPGEPAPEGLDLVIPPDVVIAGISAERAAQGVAFGFNYSNRRPFDHIRFSLGDVTDEWDITDASIPEVKTYFTSTFQQAGDNPKTLIDFVVVDQLGNFSQSATKLLDIHLGQVDLDLPAPHVEGVPEGGTLDPSQVTEVWTRVPGDALVSGDYVFVTWTDKKGVVAKYDSQEKPYTAIDSYLRFLIPSAIVQRFLGTDVSVTYTRDRDGVITGPSLPFNMSVGVPVALEPFKVMGARFNRTTYRASGSSRLLSALHATTLQPLAVQWKYEGEATWSTPSTTWRDSQPSKALQVRSSSQEATVNPANIFGNGVDTLTAGGAAFAALLDQGDVVCWGNPDFGGVNPPLSNIVEVSCTQSAYAALDRVGTVRVWGNPAEGGRMGVVSADGFVDLVGNGNAFAGRKNYGGVVAWGANRDNDLVPAEIGLYRDISAVSGSSQAFAVRRLNNPVAAWGIPGYGDSVPGGLNDVLEIIGSFAAFAALRTGGRVEAWGNPAYGGNLPGGLSGIAQLGCANAQAFCVLNNNQQVVAWGTPEYGGAGAPVPNINVVEVVSTWRAFAARRSDGSVDAWGRPNEGGIAPVGLTGVVQIAGSSEAFAALRSDGSVVAWGNQAVGGLIPGATAQRLVDVLALYANSHSFTALTANGDVVVWGHYSGGGNNDAVFGQLRNNVSYYRSPPMPRALAAQAGHASSSS
ncbi:hypothetical protein [Pseudomonas sp. NFACC45]|uniref:RCC1 domain-containing protein n=1 Tax=Pseudomonas sp. NFACC45 TaxID=1566201 RepID=UPI0008E36E5A|nr:hypothetical protein [Pseudomonas sp. NFACC45]SFH47224.1 hypothetical protein SAMN03159297_05448 [Pseudomonas sp. NFACC45]